MRFRTENIHEYRLKCNTVAQITLDDEEKMTKMKEAFEKGFKEATKTWGKKLPDISQNTRDAVLKKFDDYFAGKNS